MGDSGESAQRWMPPAVPRSLPLGKGNIYPLSEPHAVSVSLPTWDSVIGEARNESWVHGVLEWGYPRFFINKPVRDLSTAVLRRLQICDSATSCMLFASATAARKCIAALKAAPSSPEHHDALQHIRFYLPPEANLLDEPAHWADFSTVVLPSKQWEEAMAFWSLTGTGLSTRHAQFCLDQLPYLDSDSSTADFCTPAPHKRNHRQTPHPLARIRSAASSMRDLRVFLAQLATSDQPGEPVVSPDDVFLYPNGMNSIYSLSESLFSLEPNPTVAAFGWLYPETVEVLRSGRWTVLSYKHGTEAELDDLEARLQSGQKIHALFCEVPSNILLSSVNLRRIRALADTHGFLVACDDTVAGFVNLDALPCVDVMVSSLTKIFSGASNVTGGSIVISPGSRHREAIHRALSATYEDVFFPLDAETLRDNSLTVAWRVKQCNEATLPLVRLLSAHPAIATVHHPSTAPTAHHYRSVMRRDGGYGNVLSVIFHSPRSAEHFYNILDVCKGSSFGANFTLVVPYVQLANYNRDKVSKYGVPQHILRISVGLEDKDQLVATFAKALKEVELFEAQKTA